MLCNLKRMSSGVKQVFSLTRWVSTTLRSCSRRFTSAVLGSFHCNPGQFQDHPKLAENMFCERAATCEEGVPVLGPRPLGDCHPGHLPQDCHLEGRVGPWRVTWANLSAGPNIVGSGGRPTWANVAEVSWEGRDPWKQCTAYLSQTGRYCLA